MAKMVDGELSEQLAFRVNADISAALDIVQAELERDLGLKLHRTQVVRHVMGKYLRSAFPQAFEETKAEPAKEPARRRAAPRSK